MADSISLRLLKAGVKVLPGREIEKQIKILKVNVNALVFVYNPECPHCHHAMNNYVGPFLENLAHSKQYNDKLRVFGLNSQMEPDNSDFLDRNNVAYTPSFLRFAGGSDGGMGEMYPDNMTKDSANLWKFCFPKQQEPMTKKFQITVQKTEDENSSDEEYIDRYTPSHQKYFMDTRY
jgi:thiol-disulfide isomerase/thioredoxin